MLLTKKKEKKKAKRGAGREGREGEKVEKGKCLHLLLRKNSVSLLRVKHFSDH